jgi:hypothetical protein
VAAMKTAERAWPMKSLARTVPIGKTHELLCQEYVLQSDKVIYRIRPKDEKHPVLLPVGEQAQFRMEKDKMVLRVEDLDNKDRQYVVVSMTPREDSSSEKTALK